MCWNGLFAEGNRQVRETLFGKIVPSAVVSVVTGSDRRRSIPRISSSGTVYSAAAEKSSTAVTLRDARSLQNGVRRPTKKERRDRHKPTRRNDRPDCRVSRRGNRRYGIHIGARRTTGSFAKEIDLNREDARTAEARSAELFDQLERRNRFAIRVIAITLMTVHKN